MIEPAVVHEWVMSENEVPKSAEDSSYYVQIADIESDDEQEAYDFQRTTYNQTGATLEEVISEPEKFSAELLLEAALECLERNAINTAAEMYLASIVKTEICVALIGDISLSDYTFFFGNTLNTYFSAREWTDSDRAKFFDALRVARENFYAWGQKHPFSKSFEITKSALSECEVDEGEDPFRYCGKMFTWTDAEREIIVRRVTRDIVQGNYCDIQDGDDFLASEDDAYYFDRTTRKYTISNDNTYMHFQVPENVFPKLDRFGKYSGALALPSGMIEFFSSSSQECSPQEWVRLEYETQPAGISEEESIFTGETFLRETTLKGMREVAGQPGYHVQTTMYTPAKRVIRVENTLTFAGKGSNLYYVTLTSANEFDEKEGLLELEKIIATICERE